ncbi:MAG: hypothetical protein HKL81_04590 [Acidimicrobiaceae bacterium]|nr:hypothetical protein [Acidimicrobiaceae bacterium]
MALRILVALLGAINFYFAVVQLTRLVDRFGQVLYVNFIYSACLFGNSAVCAYFARGRKKLA